MDTSGSGPALGQEEAGQPAGDTGRSIPQTVAAATAFWSAVLLPLCYLPLLAGGLDGTATTAAFLALVVLHVLAIVGGRGHRPR